VKVVPTQPKEDVIEITVELEQRNLAVGTARFTGARHLNKNIAIKPNSIPGHGRDLMAHGNIEIHMKVNDKEAPMTNRFLRYWSLKPEMQ
jgi:hypothetical protein